MLRKFKLKIVLSILIVFVISFIFFTNIYINIFKNGFQSFIASKLGLDKVEYSYVEGNLIKGFYITKTSYRNNCYN